MTLTFRQWQDLMNEAYRLRNTSRTEFGYEAGTQIIEACRQLRDWAVDYIPL